MSAYCPSPPTECVLHEGGDTVFVLVIALDLSTAPGTEDTLKE